MTTTETLRGVVRRVFFCNPETPAMAGVMDLDDGGEVRFAGKVAASAGDKLEMVGEWTVHPKYGKQFNAHSGSVRMDDSPSAMVHLLATDDRFKGLGPARAQKVVDVAMALSDNGDIGEALATYPVEIADRAGVQLQIVQNAAQVWNERREYFQALAALGEQGWSNAQAQTIVHVLGDGAPNIVKGDPYMLIGRIPRFGFRTVDAIARKLGFTSTNPYRLAAGIAYCLDKIGENGDTWTTREALIAAAMQELRPDTLDGEMAVATALDGLIASGDVHIDKTPVGTEIVADARLAAIECQVFARLIDGLSNAPKHHLRFDGPELQRVMPTLNDGQREALLGFANHRFGVISGKAGTGKTYTMDAICTAMEENGLHVELCAPTGKAARKLTHATDREARTIHRLLEPRFNETTGRFTFTRHEGNPLECDLVVVDEVSMVDVKLMHSLLQALPPHAHLLLVGDHDQIPSVGAGAILRDLLSARAQYPGAVHILTEIVRQAGMLARCTSALLDGVIAVHNIPEWGIKHTERGNEEGAAAMVSMVVEHLVTSPTPLPPFENVLDLAWDVQVLSPMRKGPLGTYILNTHLQKLRQRLLGNPEPPPTELNRPPKPLVGDRIIWTVNDYELDLLNGTQAIVVSISKDGAMDLFTEDGREVTIPPAGRKNIEVAYAMTIHKAQGSEWPCVILVGSTSHWNMHDRNLFYTGASRAATSLTIMGDANGLQHFVQERKSSRRQTFGVFFVHGWRPTFRSVSTERAQPVSN